MVVSLNKAGDSTKFGGKAANLALLLRAGVEVPNGWAVSYDSFDKSGKLLEAEKLKLDSSMLYAVRSSATIEDGSEQSWAGQFETFLFVSARDVITRVEECHVTTKERAKTYAEHSHFKENFKIAVLVQEMVKPIYAGVLFTNDPVNGSKDIVVEYSEGVGEKLVGGKITPEGFTWNRKTKTIKTSKDVPFPVEGLLRVALKIESLYKGVPQDIEWAIDKKGKVWIIQTRPITTMPANRTQMSGETLSQFFEKQIPFTEWLDKIGHPDSKAIRVENSYKRERLADVAQIIPFPFDKPTTFQAVELSDRSAGLKKFLNEHGEEYCALRLIPKKGIHSEILRNRGKRIKDVMSWYDAQNINPSNYTVEFVPHMKTNKWSTIFIVNDKGLFGEIISDGHYVLTQGFHDGVVPMVFSFDFNTWRIEPHNDEALKYLKNTTLYIKVESAAKQFALKEKVGAEFVKNYMKGYFETTFSEQTGTWFIDFSRMVARSYDDYWPKFSTNNHGVLSGMVASAIDDEVSGIVKIVKNPEGVKLKKEEILVCHMTSPDYIPIMLQAKAIITDQGGILCHAAIVAREIKKPCIVGTQRATKVLKTGDRITINLKEGRVTIDG